MPTEKSAMPQPGCVIWCNDECCELVLISAALGYDHRDAGRYLGLHSQAAALLGTGFLVTRFVLLAPALARRHLSVWVTACLYAWGVSAS